MKDVNPTRVNSENRSRPIRVWDLPTRLFHWTLVIQVIFSFVTGKIGGNAMQLHVWNGFGILALLLFRLAWGFAGSRQSRFAAFVKGPATVFRYAATLLQRPGPPPYPGHNPLGGWSIMAMLSVLLLQAGTGLFANDDIVTEGPLYGWVGKATSDWITGIHKLNPEIIIALVSLHLLAILFYYFFKRENLVWSMITGIKQWSGPPLEPAENRLWTALVIIALTGLAVYVLVR
ncbi:MAG: cytochrome b/b6 domain-containing protein [Desulfobacterales bacterium]|nr:cytochrome b/b6 domain-containing protein [Desulfobacterales bacterium]